MPIDLSDLDASSTALIRTVDALGAEELAAPSLLPGWSRAHVVAHLALNGEALAGVMDAVLRGDAVAMYESNEQRDRDIEELAGAGQAELLDRMLSATTQFSDAALAMDDDAWDGWFCRTPGTEQVPVATVPQMRRREVEIHHADLGTVYGHVDWPQDFVIELLDVVTVDQAPSGPFTVRAEDLGRSWAVGGDGGDRGPTVTGTGADLGWWLTGRGGDGALSTDGGGLPTLGPWRRASATAARTPER
ncbi:MAG: maleylpyruvate isomerase family mycothiol-dependent enzyme [Marmoricola sp.]|nr:maleylpyruvate isomerase family mycothiol-dependent enzyme [Marmoricola sp.]